MRKLVAAAAMLFAISTATQAQVPTASLSGGYVFKDWLTVNNATIGIGNIDDNNTVYYLMEKNIGGLQSWLIFFDPAATQHVTGTITFGSMIVSLFKSSVDVNTTSAAYRLSSGVTYGAAANTGLEPEDAASFAGNTLSIDFTASDPGDHIRVLVVGAPEPATYTLMLTGLAALAATARRRRKA